MREKKPKIETKIEPVDFTAEAKRFENHVETLAGLFSCEPVQVAARLGELVHADFILPGQTPSEIAELFRLSLVRYDNAKHRKYFFEQIDRFWLDTDEFF